MGVYISKDGIKFETAEDKTPEELAEPLSVIISLKPVITWSKTANDAKNITDHMIKELVEVRRKLEGLTTWNEYMVDVVESYAKLVPSAVLSYCEAPGIPEETPSEAGQASTSNETPSDSKTD